MSSSLSMEEKIEVLIKQNAEKEAQNEYLRKQLYDFMRQRRTIEIPEFEGRIDPDEFLKWLQAVERVFEFKEIPEDKKVKNVALKLRSFASLWWTHLLAKRVRQGKKKIRTWEKMKSKLKARFLPPTYLQKKYSRPHHLTPTLPTFDEVCMLAHKVKPPPKEQPLNKGSSSYSSKPETPSFPIPQKNQAPQKILTPQNRPNPIPTTPRLCFKCQGLGHIASECPNRQIVSLAEWEVQKEEEEKEDWALCLMEESQEEDQEEVVEEPDDGKSASEAMIILDNPQKLEEEQAGVTRGFKPYLIQEECPYHQQELRTILFQQGENDGYLLGHPLHPCETSAFEVTSCQISAWTDLSSSPLFEFRGKRHFMEFLLNFKIPWLIRRVRLLRNQQMLREVARNQGMLFSEQYSSKCIFVALVA